MGGKGEDGIPESLPKAAYLLRICSLRNCHTYFMELASEVIFPTYASFTCPGMSLLGNLGCWTTSRKNLDDIVKQI